MQGGYRKLRQPPSDVLKAVIPLQVRDSWRSNPTPELSLRLEFLSACGPGPSDKLGCHRLMHCRAVRAAWEAYVYCAFACGFFEGERGAELRGRLASADRDDFRSAMAECMACWFFAGRLGLPVTPSAPGKGARMLDMATTIDGLPVGVEVKAPYQETPKQAWCGHDGKHIGQCLVSANRQFAENAANILVLVPRLKTPVFQFRTQLVSALYGEEKITCLIDTRTGKRAGPVTTEFFPEGRLLRRVQPSGALVKPDGTPGFTRVSAVLVIEERMREKHCHPISLVEPTADDSRDGALNERLAKQFDLYDSGENERWIDHDILVAHNPHARRALSPDGFGDCVQFRDLLHGQFGWSDGAPI